MYNSVIVDHFTNPSNTGEITDKDIQIKIGNSVCGDTIFIDIKLDRDHIINAKFKAYGCATSIATADIFSEYIIGKSFKEIQDISVTERKEMLGELDPSQMHCLHILEELFTKLDEHQGDTAC
ncbi:iron-sulfur cluster assembly scaffold protein [Chengkuizengella axinellae]|uniref:Iron-sulfur cluster assembly scaffold protein n=1 Tax=Chengkuizengella axinellae TaxID=3064388 RepID=A0ABT9IU30_9BACL|nr:iron-sulfur cluster assembly scaffold protein [Chengkuizengella sp. 2205SS18-9]MDP5272823.1 iron-sulfur cluster assembly scaffold protein [Chengkuizengella sp. 2205SS18-9]